MKKIISSIFLLSSVIAFAQTTSNEKLLSNKANWNVYTVDEFSINYPTTWDLAELSNPMLKFTLTSRPTSADDIFRENINLVSEDISSNSFSTEEYVNLSLNQIKAAFENFHLISNEKVVTTNGNEFQQIVYTATTAGFNLKFQQNFIVLNGKSYILTFTAEENKYNDYDELSYSIIDTFRFH